MVLSLRTSPNGPRATAFKVPDNALTVKVSVTFVEEVPRKYEVSVKVILLPLTMPADLIRKGVNDNTVRLVVIVFGQSCLLSHLHSYTALRPGQTELGSIAACSFRPFAM